MTEHRVEDLQRLYVLLGRVNALPVSVNGECCHVNGEILSNAVKYPHSVCVHVYSAHLCGRFIGPIGVWRWSFVR